MEIKLTLQDIFKYLNAKIIRYKKEGKEYIWDNSVLMIGHFSKHSFSLLDYLDCNDYTFKLQLRSIDNLTDVEKIIIVTIEQKERIWDYKQGLFQRDRIDYLRSINIDIDGFIEAGIAEEIK